MCRIAAENESLSGPIPCRLRWWPWLCHAGTCAELHLWELKVKLSGIKVFLNKFTKDNISDILSSLINLNYFDHFSNPLSRTTQNDAVRVRLHNAPVCIKMWFCCEENSIFYMRRPPFSSTHSVRHFPREELPWWICAPLSQWQAEPTLVWNFSRKWEKPEHHKFSCRHHPSIFGSTRKSCGNSVCVFWREIISHVGANLLSCDKIDYYKW